MNLDELEKLADAATKEDTKETDWLLDDEGWVWASDYWGYQTFIAAANPAVIKQLIALVRLQHTALIFASDGITPNNIKNALDAFDNFGSEG